MSMAGASETSGGNLARQHADSYSEGVLVAKKDYNLPKHNEIDTKNLYVRCPLKDLQSKLN